MLTKAILVAAMATMIPFVPAVVRADPYPGPVVPAVPYEPQPPSPPAPAPPVPNLNAGTGDPAHNICVLTGHNC
jgi:hypothetical protein